MRIKICGITNLEDALAAIDAGADLLGFNLFPKSPRYVPPDECARIIARLRESQARLALVGVFVNARASDVAEQLDRCGLDQAQLHGDEPPETLAVLGGRAYKALRPTTSAGMEAALARYPDRGMAPALLVDACLPGRYGGTGRTADWGLARQLARRRPVLLAGGLKPENVAEAVRQVRPWGVDVASGVESSPGRKEVRKMMAFVNAARGADREIGLTIGPAHVGDAAEILALQKLAYRSEAELNQDFTLPPLTQTLPEIQAEFAGKLFLKAVADGRIVGSVRAEALDGTCRIGRLVVHPDWQNQGLGSRMMRAIEARFGEVARYELFTSERSTRNLYLYQKLGYKVFRHELLNERVRLCYLEKRRERL